MNTGNISFSEKKVSKNAVLTLVMGIGILIGFAILTVLSIVTEEVCLDVFLLYWHSFVSFGA